MLVLRNRELNGTLLRGKNLTGVTSRFGEVEYYSHS